MHSALLGFVPLLMKPSAMLSMGRTEGQGPWPEILQHALMCPSVHNIQPWKVRIDSSSSATVFFESGSQIPYADRDGAFMSITMAMFAQSIVKISATKGFKAAVDYEPYEKLPLNAGLVRFCTVELEPQPSSKCLDVSAFYTRRTARFGYSSKKVDHATLNDLAATVNAHGHLLSYTTDEVRLQNITHLAVEAMFEDLNDDRYRDELKTWIRTGGTEQQSRDGLSAACLGQPDGITKKFFEHPGRFRSGFKQFLLKEHYRQSLKHTNAIFWLGGNFDTYQHWLQCGKSLLDLWLQLASCNLYIQPFGNLITNRHSHELLKGLTGTAGETWFIARVGYCETPPASVRKSLSTILIS